ncbi:MAG: hypothetical protein HZB56_09450 [Deltaproteobacteria bacterium]|nr:hypothetical protein [Deltaproteobacteria bacterium]
MTRTRTRKASQGMTILELLFVVAIASVVIAGITKVVADMMKTNQARLLGAQVQGEGRTSLTRIEGDLRLASLGSTYGMIFTQDTAGNVAIRPAVQVYDNVTARNANAIGGRLVKAGTDALLVVAARPEGARAQAWVTGKGTNFDSTAPLYLTTRTGFAVNQHVLVGPYLYSTWGKITGLIDASAGGLPAGINFTSGAVNVNAYPQGKLDNGSAVREAEARLYFVNDRDELVSVLVDQPRAPQALAEVLSYEVHATGVENLQVDCEIDTGTAFAACPAAAADAEASWALGAGTTSRFGVGDTSRYGVAFAGDTRQDVAFVRTLILSVVVRSPRPVRDQRGDPTIAIGNNPALGPLAYNPETNQPYQLADGDAFLRRAYRVPVAIRNVSLGVY